MLLIHYALDMNVIFIYFIICVAHLLMQCLSFSACCKGCEDRAKGLIHPSCGSHLVGHDEEPDEDYM